MLEHAVQVLPNDVVLIIPRFDVTKQGECEGVAGFTNQKVFHKE
jgi:hypothetical protein